MVQGGGPDPEADFPRGGLGDGEVLYPDHVRAPMGVKKSGLQRSPCGSGAGSVAGLVGAQDPSWWTPGKETPYQGMAPAQGGEGGALPVRSPCVSLSLEEAAPASVSAPPLTLAPSMARETPEFSPNGDIHGSPDASLGGYFREHERPPAFEGRDGEPYTVSVETEKTPDLRAPWEGYLVFPRWASTGLGVLGHVETPTLVRGRSREDVIRALGQLPLVHVKTLLDEALERNSMPEGSEDKDASRDAS